MKTGGRARLQYEITADDAPPHRSGANADQALVTQTAFFEPKGLAGLLYWYALYIPHRFIFTGMIEELSGVPSSCRSAAATASCPTPRPSCSPE